MNYVKRVTIRELLVAFPITFERKKACPLPLWHKKFTKKEKNTGKLIWVAGALLFRKSTHHPRSKPGITLSEGHYQRQQTIDDDSTPWLSDSSATWCRGYNPCVTVYRWERGIFFIQTHYRFCGSSPCHPAIFQSSELGHENFENG